MSMKPVCDRCLNTIDNVPTNKNDDYLDFAAVLRGVMLCSYEDLCDSCIEDLQAVIQDYIDFDGKSKAPIENITVNSPIIIEDEEYETEEFIEEPEPEIEQQEIKETKKEEPQAAPLSERVVKRIPIS